LIHDYADDYSDVFEEMYATQKAAVSSLQLYQNHRIGSKRGRPSPSLASMYHVPSPTIQAHKSRTLSCPLPRIEEERETAVIEATQLHVTGSGAFHKRSVSDWVRMAAVIESLCAV